MANDSGHKKYTEYYTNQTMRDVVASFYAPDMLLGYRFDSDGETFEPARYDDGKVRECSSSCVWRWQRVCCAGKSRSRSRSQSRFVACPRVQPAAELNYGDPAARTSTAAGEKADGKIQI